MLITSTRKGGISNAITINLQRYEFVWCEKKRSICSSRELPAAMTNATVKDVAACSLYSATVTPHSDTGPGQSSTIHFYTPLQSSFYYSYQVKTEQIISEFSVSLI